MASLPPEPSGKRPPPNREPLAALGAWFQWAIPHLKTLNARVAGWAAEASWKRITLLGLVVFLASATVSDILDVGNPTVVRVGPEQPIKIDIKSDPSGVTIQPMVGGKPTKSAHIPLTSDDSQRGSGPSGSASEVPGDVDKDAIRFESDGKQIIIDSHGVRVVKPSAAPPAPSPPPKPDTPDHPAGTGSGPTEPPGSETKPGDGPGRTEDQARRADLQEQVRDAIESATDDIKDAIAEEEASNSRKMIVRREGAAFWDFFKILLTVAFAYLVAIKVSTSNKQRADALVRSASQVAEHESLRRQVLEARMQTMQAQVEPHFLFNTLSSVDYLIETDPARASTMQKNLIQYLRAALPQMRESSTTLGREVDLVRAYLEILKVRMEERLRVSFHVPDGLRSADFPPMMLQSLVENAIKHGLEPKAEGGALTVSGEVADGDLFVSVIDTGLGFNPEGAATSGGGVGLANIRERLTLLYGGRARFIIAANEPSGTQVSIIIPYQPTARRS